MTNYLIDASVYAYPFYGKNPGKKEIEGYFDVIKDLYNLVVEKQPRNFRFYLCARDIKFILAHPELDFTSVDISEITQIAYKTKKSEYVQTIQRNLLEIFEILENGNIYVKVSNNKTDKRREISKYIMFERTFKIEDISFGSNIGKSILSDPLLNIQDKDLRENTRKNLAMVAALNKFVYKNDQIQSIILGGNESINKIQISADFNATMMFYLDNQGNSTKPYKILDFPKGNIHIVKVNIKISTLDALTNYKYQYKDIMEAFNQARIDFKDHLVFGPKVWDPITQRSESIDEYIKKINEYHNSLTTKEYDDENEKEKKELEKWMKELPDILYEHLKSLNDFIKVADFLNIQKQPGLENYVCSPSCEFFNLCRSNLCFFGVNCSKESDYIKKVTNARKGNPSTTTGSFVSNQCRFTDNLYEKNIFNDRKKENTNGDKNVLFNLHLKPITFGCYQNLWFLTLRIHFRRIIGIKCSSYINCKKPSLEARAVCIDKSCPNFTKKIEIGWIGRHLFWPSCDSENIKKCTVTRQSECPLHPKAQFANYLKQWQ